MDKIKLLFKHEHLALINEKIPEINVNQSIFTPEELLLIKQNFAPKQDDISKEIFHLTDKIAFDT